MLDKAVISLLLSFSLVPAHAAITITNPGTSHVDLRTDCSGSLNCADNLEELLTWVWTQRVPSATNPLVIDIGPGNFSAQGAQSLGGGAFCNNAGWVTFRGAGRENTVIIKGVGSLTTIDIVNCTQIAFQDLTIDSGSSIYGLYWTGGGSSSYSNVTLTGKSYPWYDSCGSSPRSVHYWSGSRILTSGDANRAVAYLSRCAESWFYGTEIVAHANINTREIIPIDNQGGEIHVYGGVIRALSDPGITLTGLGVKLFTAVNTTANGETHIHGTGIDVISAEGNPVSSLTAGSGGHIHAAQSSYILQTGANGTASRIVNNGGHVHAPFLWEHVPDTDGNPLTVDTNFFSVNGADMTVVTTDTSDGHPHIAVYSSACGANAKWYDQVDKVCRDK